MRSATLELLAVVNGRVVPIEAVPDAAFAAKMVGDGLALEPDDALVVAPCDGRVAHVHRAKHAYTVEAPTGARVLVHVGIDTVELKGDGFKPRVKEGDAVRAGQPLVEIDRARLRKKGANPLTLVVVEDFEAHPVAWRAGAGAVLRAGADVALRLGREAAPALPAAARGPAPGSDAALSRRVRVAAAEGLHARPGARVAAAARRFTAEVTVRFQGRAAAARSALALMGLATSQGDEVEVSAAGPDAAAALEAVAEAIGTEEPGGAAPAAQAPRTTTAAGAGTTAGGVAPSTVVAVPASGGFAVGRTAWLRRPEPVPDAPPRGEPVERAALEKALRETAADVGASAAAARLRGAEDEAAILEAHLALLDDPALRDAAFAAVASGVAASAAVRGAAEAQAALLGAAGRALLAERVADLRDLAAQIVARLAGGQRALPPLPPGVILLADDLAPGELAALDPTRLAGIALERGGPTSHVAIVARGHGLPALVAAGPALRAVPEGEEAVIDGESGVLRWRLAAAALAEGRARAEAARARQSAARSAAAGPAITRDGVRVEVAANVASAAEAADAAAAGAEGVGLLRTELLLGAFDAPPGEEAQRAAYAAVIEALRGRPVVLRTLDAGADKPLRWLPMPPEENPALGVRGLRLCLARPDLFAVQLRAALRAGPPGTVSLLLPMVNELAELRAARALVAREAAALGVPVPPVGVMVETPAAALLADALAAEADFLSLGTNDLTQYTLAVDRGHPALAGRADALHPAVLRLAASAAAGASRRGRPLAVCGGAAADRLGVPLLVGLGARELSVEPGAVAEVKALVRALHARRCEALARRALLAPGADEVRALVRAELEEMARG